MKKLKVGIVSFAHMHAASYTGIIQKLEDAELVGIADSDEFRGSEMAARFGTRYFPEYTALLDGQTDALIVCTDNRSHCRVTVDAARRGKHVLVEKPLAIDAQSAREMVRAAEQGGVVLMNALPMRFSTCVIEVKRRIERGEIGRILSISGINHGKIPDGWFLDTARAGGGSVMDHTVHLLDLMRWFTQSECREVYCEYGSLIHNRGIDDCGIVHVRFENGVFATIDCSWAHHRNYPIWPQVDMEIIGTKGVLSLRAFSQVERIYDARSLSAEDVSCGNDGDFGLVREFVSACLENRKPSGATGEDGVRALEVALAAYRSGQEHRCVPVEDILCS